jgi:hypothetical protein
MLKADTGFDYIVQTSSNLTNWTSWKTLTTFSTSTIVTDSIAAGGSQKLYRATALSP